ncbi:MAG: sulfite exporter TauE/SafE family protein [Gemmatimonadetes bacterium]|nr:sulfite exporter TauE/SafE family protein [Gemmatimonadota bacterium]
MIAFIWASLALLTVWYLAVLARDVARHRQGLAEGRWGATGLVGFVTNFFDVLGIGAFAPQTAALKFMRQADDRLIPGTLNVSNTLPVLLQALIFITIVEVEPLTLVLMLLAAAVGAVFGADVVARLSERRIRMTMGIALLVTAGFMVARSLDWIQGGGDAIGLHGAKLAIAVVANALLGALNTAGVGLYAPCMALVFALGMSPRVAFPIMMGSCAFLMPPASVRFIGAGAYNRRAAVAIAIGGLVAVPIAAFVVKELPLDVLRWVVIAVILYTAGVMLRAAFSK